MAVVMMTKENAPGAYKSSWNNEDIWMEKRYEGCVVALGEHNWYDDSDFYALVWDADEREFKKFEYATTRFWTYPNGAAVDASDEIKALWESYNEIADAERRYFARLADAKSVAVGKRVKVVKGRKVKVGTEWWVVSIEPNRYDSRNARVGLRNDETGERVWTYENNLEVLGMERIYQGY